MNKPTLIPYKGKEKCPFIFFDEFPEKALCKIHHDGGHYIATPYFPMHTKAPERTKHERGEVGEILDSLLAQRYTVCETPLKRGKNREETRDFLRDNLAHLFDNENELTAYIDGELERKMHLLHMRKKRFRRKAFLNKWTHFITITYDDKKHDETSFRRKLRKCLSNFHTRRGWKFMGVFERAPETGRLHFHALLFVPQGKMVGELTEKQDYSTKAGKMQKTISNDFFAEKFGRNDFSEISPADIKHGNTLAYLLKYIEKTGERITYSRGLPTELCRMVYNEDVAGKLYDFVVKYVLFDDVFDYDEDGEEWQGEPEQMEIFPRLLC